MKSSKFTDSSWFVLGVFLIVAMPASWFTHVICCLQDERWGFLIAGAIFFPVAIIHGIMIWLGLA